MIAARPARSVDSHFGRSGARSPQIEGLAEALRTSKFHGQVKTHLAPRTLALSCQDHPRAAALEGHEISLVGSAFRHRLPVVATPVLPPPRDYPALRALWSTW